MKLLVAFGPILLSAACVTTPYRVCHVYVPCNDPPPQPIARPEVQVLPNCRAKLSRRTVACGWNFGN